MLFGTARLTVLKTICRSHPRPHTRSFASSRPPRADRAVIYSENGDPSEVLNVLTFPDLPPPGSDSVTIQFLLSPINPADINVIEGVYPSKPIKTGALASSGKGSEEEPVFIGGNEGLAQVTAVGSSVSSLKINDWVVVTKQQHGTWSTRKNVAVTDVALIPDAHKLDEAQAATITASVLIPTCLYLTVRRLTLHRHIIC
jgi:trans-2-enoyl-CoA reductase